MKISEIFNVFSRRAEISEKTIRPLTKEFRSRVMMFCEDARSDHVTSHLPFAISSFGAESFWPEIHKKLQYLHGNPMPIEGVTDFLLQCNDEHFLDFVEMIFQTRYFGKSRDHLVDNINKFFDEDALPYHLTDFVYSPVKQIPASELGLSSGKSDGGIRGSTLESYPQVICLENEVLYETAMEPTLTLLAGPAFSQANEEFLEALKDYRKGDYRDCVAKCGSSFESVMKVICDRRNWPYQQTDAAAKLLKTILQQTTLDSFYEQPIMLIATIRNRLSTAHGAGTQQKTVSKHVAQYVINATASAILLLVDETKP